MCPLLLLLCCTSAAYASDCTLHVTWSTPNIVERTTVGWTLGQQREETTVLDGNVRSITVPVNSPGNYTVLVTVQLSTGSSYSRLNLMNGPLNAVCNNGIAIVQPVDCTLHIRWDTPRQVDGITWSWERQNMANSLQSDSNTRSIAIPVRSSGAYQVTVVAMLPRNQRSQNLVDTAINPVCRNKGGPPVATLETTSASTSFSQLPTVLPTSPSPEQASGMPGNSTAFRNTGASTRLLESMITTIGSCACTVVFLTAPIIF